MEQKYTEGKGILIQPYSFQIGLPIIKVISLDNGSAADPLLLRRSAYIAETLIFFFFFFFLHHSKHHSKSWSLYT